MIDRTGHPSSLIPHPPSTIHHLSSIIPPTHLALLWRSSAQVRPLDVLKKLFPLPRVLHGLRRPELRVVDLRRPPALLQRPCVLFPARVQRTARGSLPRLLAGTRGQFPDG